MKKRISKSANMYVMFGLLAVLFVSLGYLSMQGSREGLTISTDDIKTTDEKDEKDEKKEDKPITIPDIKVSAFRGGREGMAKKK
jgi:hypothetical protein